MSVNQPYLDALERLRELEVKLPAETRLGINFVLPGDWPLEAIIQQAIRQAQEAQAVQAILTRARVDGDNPAMDTATGSKQTPSLP